MKFHKSTTVIEHKGKQIVYLDYRFLKTPEEFEAKVSDTMERSKFYEENDIRGLLVLTDLSGSFIFGDAPKYLKESTKLGRDFVAKSAVVGITRAKRVLLNLVNSFSGYQTKAFLTIEEAKDWLVI